MLCTLGLCEGHARLWQGIQRTPNKLLFLGMMSLASVASRSVQQATKLEEILVYKQSQGTCLSCLDSLADLAQP